MSDPVESAYPSAEPITERPSALLASLRKAEVSVFVLGPDFTVQWVNEATEEYFGLDGGAVVGEDKRALIESTIKSLFERPDRFAETVIETYEDNTYVEEFECHVLPGADREERWLLHQSHPIEEGELAGGRIEHYTDITERMERERELRRRNERLDEFASRLSHDVRNPLNVARGHLELIEAECDGEHVDAIERSHDRIDRLIDDVLALARQGQTAVDVRPVELASLVRRCWGAVETTDATLAVETDRTIRADPGRLERLLENLIRNAVEHGGAAVTVTVGDLRDGFYVADDGSGFPDDEGSEVFAKGYSTTRDGTGMGLSIVKQIADTHGWTVETGEGPDSGARFEIGCVEHVG